MDGLMSKLRNFDAYPKINEDFYSRTLSGGVITLASSIVMFLLFFSELRLYLHAVTETKLVVDTSRGETLRINVMFLSMYVFLSVYQWLDVTFPALPCSILSLDAMDISGEQHLDVKHDIIKKRLDSHGNVIEARQDGIGSPKCPLSGDRDICLQVACISLMAAWSFVRSIHSMSQRLKNPCRGMVAGLSTMRHTVVRVMVQKHQMKTAVILVRKFAKHIKERLGSDKSRVNGPGILITAGIAWEYIHTWATGYVFAFRGCISKVCLVFVRLLRFCVPYCKREGFLQRIKDEEGEGCNIYGFLEVNKVAGNFHFAPGKSFQQSGVHVHDLLAFQKDSFNVSHDFTSWLVSTYGISITDLVFAKENEPINFFLNAHHVMVSKPSDKCTQCGTDNVQWTPETPSGMYQYFIKVVPTVYTDVSGHTIQSNQFSVTEHSRGADIGHIKSLPGVFFFYDLSPIKVTFTEEHVSFLHFLTNVCAIVGGVFTVSGILDSFIYHGQKAIKKKMEIGKFS
ncbi:hypothetical protein POTOM_009949 [Populus tomentosa]|uniref:Endoplasmic reticulum vesicle transporter protein n=1 Tax=Populus tomentosa TaxID=118781 RepID=A0A8X8A999_POPTO|nr:hypothetical protein POTOM_009949 [Populus tomentosa]